MVRNIEPERGAVIPVPQHFTQPSLGLLDTLLETHLRDHTSLVMLDFSKVSQVDSAAMNWLLALQEKVHANEGHVQINNPSVIMNDALVATRLDARFPIETTAVRREGDQ